MNQKLIPAHRPNRFPSAWPLCAMFALSMAACSTGRAQTTNVTSGTNYQAFRIIFERNIFDPNRSSRSGRGADSPRPATVESFALVGTLSYEKGTFAFFDGSGSSYRKALKAGEAIGGYKIAQITANRVKLTADDQTVELGVGMQMKKQDGGEWQLAGRAESFGSPGPTTASTDKTDSAGGAAVNDVLKKLMEKREQDLK